MLPGLLVPLVILSFTKGHSCVIVLLFVDYTLERFAVSLVQVKDTHDSIVKATDEQRFSSDLYDGGVTAGCLRPERLRSDERCRLLLLLVAQKLLWLKQANFAIHLVVGKHSS